MRLYGLWHGGSGYSAPEDSDLEAFTSIADARDKLINRYRYGYWQRSRFDFVERPVADVLTPCVGDDTSILLYGSRDSLDYPGWRLSLGSRGGVRTERL